MDTEKAIQTINEILKRLGTPAETVTYAWDDKRGHIFVINRAES